MTILEVLNSHIDKYEELEGIAEMQLMNGYSKGWWKELYENKSKLEALKRFKEQVEKSPSKDLHFLGKRKMYLLYGYVQHCSLIALVDPELVHYIDTNNYSDNLIKLYSKISYNEYDEECTMSVGFYCSYVKCEYVDVESLQAAHPDLIVWDSYLKVDSYEKAHEIKRKIEFKLLGRS